MRRVTTIILYDNKKILMQLRDSSAPTLANQWGHFGGGFEENETALQCVKRECFEELEYVLKNPQKIETITTPSAEFHIFIEKYNGSELIQHEGADLGWFSKKDIEELDLHPLIYDISIKVFEKLQ